MGSSVVILHGVNFSNGKIRFSFFPLLSSAVLLCYSVSSLGYLATLTSYLQVKQGTGSGKKILPVPKQPAGVV